MPTQRPRVNVTFDLETYKQIKNISKKTGDSMSDIIRSWSEQGLNGDLNAKNIDFLSKIIRNELENILTVHTNRLASLNAKTCIQAGTAAYLSAEAILKFVPEHRRIEIEDTYELARKKAVAYLRGNTDMED